MLSFPVKCQGLWALVMLLAIAFTRPAEAISLYQIGNSLTNNSTPEGVRAMATLAGLDVSGGYHVRGNSTLEEIWNDAEGSGVLFDEEVGRFNAALPNQAWDHITLQVSDGGVLTVDDNVAWMGQFRDLARLNPDNADTKYYMYGAWPWTSRWQDWENPLSPTEASWHTRATFDEVYERLEATMPGEFSYIPAGEVFDTIRQRQDGEAFEGRRFISNFYLDAIHLNEIGRYVAATTVFSTVFRTNPIGVPVPRDQSGWGFDRLSDELALEIQEVVWEVVSQDPRTGVILPGDFNVDTRVDEVDLQILLDSFGARTNVTADTNGDNRVDSEDVMVWLDASELGAADINADGFLDALDFQLYRSAYGTAGETAEDANGDGFVDAADYTILRDKAESLLAVDFNQNGLADNADLVLIQSQLGWATHLPADANGDGLVDNADFLIWEANQDNPGGTAVPEPSALLVTVFAAGGLLSTRRRAA